VIARVDQPRQSQEELGLLRVGQTLELPA
jgi:hypothetical protein